MTSNCKRNRFEYKIKFSIFESLMVFQSQAKKEEQERKRLEALQKKNEAKELLDQEEAELKAQAIKKGGQTQKLSRAQIREEAARREAIARGKANEEVKTHLSTPLEENVNRVQVEGVEARTVDEALNVLRFVRSDVTMSISKFYCIFQHKRYSRSR